MSIETSRKQNFEFQPLYRTGEMTHRDWGDLLLDIFHLSAKLIHRQRDIWPVWTAISEIPEVPL